MLYNYFKIAIAVLKRRKFFTFISLFGISFTLTILIVITALIDHIFSDHYPDGNRNKTLYISLIKAESSKKGWSKNSPLSFYFLNEYVKKLPTPQYVGMGSMFTPVNSYHNNKKLVINQKFTNDEFWQALNFDFIEGKPYTQQQIQNREKLVVISEEIRDKYFGKGVKSVGRFIEADNIQYKVAGVVKNVPVTKLYAYGDMFLPYTLTKANLNTKDYHGTYMAILVAKNANDVAKMQQEYASLIARLPVLDKEFDKISSYADTYLASFTRTFFGKGSDSGVGKFIIILSLFFFIFMLLPTLNLININISRIIERSSEIGVRKAFGASSQTLVWQFITENLILTFIGCLLGLLLSATVLYFVNSAGFIANANLHINFKVLLYALGLCIFFGLLSGVYPAWRMSRMHVAKALKA